MHPEKRIEIMLELSKQHMQRFHELEQIEWRINFSIWAAIGGLAYLWAHEHVEIPVWFNSNLTALTVPVVPLILHGWALIMINLQQHYHSGRRQVYWDKSAISVGVRPEESRDKKLLMNLRGSTWRWIVWDLSVTYFITLSTFELIRNLRNP